MKTVIYHQNHIFQPKNHPKKLKLLLVVGFVSVPAALTGVGITLLMGFKCR